jgi:hypothetical protein
MGSERPEGLNALELEEYELAIEEQAYPFEERAIAVHESNLELIAMGVYNAWIDKSLERLAEFLPARYAKSEVESPVLASLESFSFEIATLPAETAAEESAEKSLADEEEDASSQDADQLAEMSTEPSQEERADEDVKE